MSGDWDWEGHIERKKQGSLEGVLGKGIIDGWIGGHVNMPRAGAEMTEQIF